MQLLRNVIKLQLITIIILITPTLGMSDICDYGIV